MPGGQYPTPQRGPWLAGSRLRRKSLQHISPARQNTFESTSGTVASIISVTHSTYNDEGTGAETAVVSWLANDLIIVVGMTEDTTVTLADPTASGLTFADIGSPITGASAGWIHRWQATAAADGTSVTVSASAGEATTSVRGISVYVIRGSAGLGNHASDLSTARSLDLTRTYDNSLVIYAAEDWGVGGTSVTYTPSGETVRKAEQIIIGGGRATCYVVDWGDQGSAGTTTYGITGTGANFAKIVLEIRPSSSDGTAISTGNSGGTNGSAFNNVTVGGSATLRYDNLRAAHGNFSAEFQLASSQLTNLEWNLPATIQHWSSLNFYIGANPSTNITLYETRETVVGSGSSGTNVFLRNTNADAAVTVGSGTKWKADWSAGASATHAIKTTVAGPTAPLQITDSAINGSDGTVLSWYTTPLEAVTIAGAITCSLWCRENATNNNIAPTIRIERTSGDGTVLGTIVAETTSHGAGEMATTAGGASDTISVTAGNVTDTVLSQGDRLRITLWIDDAAGQGGTGNMASGSNGEYWVNGPNGSQGQAQIAFTETLTEYVAPTTSLAARLGCNTSGQLTLAPASGTVAHTFTNAITAGAWNRIEFNVINSTGTGTLQARLYSGDSLVIVEDSGPISTSSTRAASTDHLFGQTVATASTTSQYWLDDVEVDTTGWFTQPARVPPTLIQYTETTWTGTAASKDTASISWLADDWIVVFGGTENVSTTISTVGATGLTFNAGSALNVASSCWANTWTAQASGSGSSVVTATRAGSSGDYGISVWVVRDSDGPGYRAALTNANKDVTMNLTKDESMIVTGLLDFNAGATTGYSFIPTPSTEREVTQDGAQYTIYVADWLDQGLVDSWQHGIIDTASTGLHSKIALEVLGTNQESGAGSQTINASSVQSDEEFGNVAVTPGATTLNIIGIGSDEKFGTTFANLTVSPSSIRSDEKFGNATTSVVVSINAYSIGSDERFGNVTTTPGAVTVSSVGIPSEQKFGHSTATPGAVTISPTSIVSEEKFGNSTVVAGSVQVVAVGVPSGQAFGNSVASPGPATVTSIGIPTEQRLGNVTVTLAQTINTTSISSSERFGSATATPGSVTVAASSVTSDEKFGNTQVATGISTISSIGIPSDERFGNVTTTPGAISLAIIGISTEQKFGNTNIVAGQVTISSHSIVTNEKFGSTSLTQGPASINPAGINSSESLGSVTIQPGSVNVTAKNIQSSERFGNIATSVVNIIGAHSIDTEETFGIISLVAGIVGLNCHSIYSGESFGQVQVLTPPAVPPTPVATIDIGFAIAQAELNTLEVDIIDLGIATVNF